jgi:hypothetical protein
MEADHCYCVLLNARGGAAFPPDTATENESSRTSHEAKLLGESQGPNPPKVTLFSGFVNYDMVRNAYEGEILCLQSKIKNDGVSADKDD